MSVGRDLISRVTDAVTDDVPEWQSRALEDVYPFLFLDALVVKVSEGGTVQRKACYLGLAITMDGQREVLGMWFQETEGAKFWMQVLADPKQRGVQDILICCGRFAFARGACLTVPALGVPKPPMALAGIAQLLGAATCPAITGSAAQRGVYFGTFAWSSQAYSVFSTGTGLGTVTSSDSV